MNLSETTEMAIITRDNDDAIKEMESVIACTPEAHKTVVKGLSRNIKMLELLLDRQSVVIRRVSESISGRIDWAKIINSTGIGGIVLYLIAAKAGLI